MADPATTQPGVDEVAAAAARACATDPEIQALLTRKATGVRLTPQEYGKLGGWKSKQKRGRSSECVNPPASGDPAAPGLEGDFRAVSSLAPPDVVSGAAADDRIPLSPADATFVARTVGALLTSADNIGRRHLVITARAVAAAALKAGVPAPSVARFESATVVSPDHRAVMVDTAPLAAEALGMNPRHLPVMAFFGSAGLVALDFMSAVKELREIQERIESLGSPGAKPSADHATATQPA